GGGEPGSLEVMLTSVGVPLCKRSNPTMELALHLLETELKAAAAYLTELSTRLQMVGEERATERGKAEATAPPTTTTTTPQITQPPDTSQQQQQQAMDTDQPQDQQQPGPAQQHTAASQSEQPNTGPSTSAPSDSAPPGPSASAPTPPTPAPTATPAAAAAGGAGAAPSTPAPPSTSAAATATGAPTEGADGGGGFGSPVTAPSATPSQATAGAGATGGTSPSAQIAALDANEAKLLAAQQEARAVLQGLPPKLVRQLAGLLSEEGLSDTTYARASTSVRTLVDVSPPHLPTVLDELRSGVQRLAHTLSTALNAAHASPAALNPDSADSALLGSVASQGGMVLRSLSALQAFRKAQQ
ncbi:hypothetical protein DUNSADRAFT_14405, partial [Dunaliella salina]